MEEQRNNQTNLETKNAEESQAKVENAEEQEKKKKKKKKRKMICCIIAASLLLIGGGVCFYINYTKNLQGYGGVGAINDSMAVSLERPIDIVAMLSGCKPIGGTMAGEVIEDIASLKAAFEANKNALLASGDSVIVIPTIGIKFDIASTTPLSAEMVKEYASYFMQTDQSATILVEGYACNIGDEQSNMELSRNRASTVKQMFMECGIPETSIEVQWYGESKFNTLGYQNLEEHRRVNISIK